MAGRQTFSWRSHMSTRRMLPTSVIFRKTNWMACRTRSSGSFSIFPLDDQPRPIGRGIRNSPRLLANRFRRALAKQVQFKLRHGPSEAQKQTIVNERRIVDTVRVHQDGAKHSTHLNEMVPVATVTR